MRKKKFTLRFAYAVYADFTTESVPRPFYVGKGNEGRCCLTERNIIHKRISKKHGFERRVLLETDDESFALETEIQLIESLKTYSLGGEGWWGANLTRGGDNSPMKDPHVAAKVSASKMGHPVSEAQRMKQSKSMKLAHINDPTLGTRNGDSMRGKHHTSETLTRMCESHKHRKPISEDTRAKQRLAAREREFQKKLRRLRG